MISSNSARTTYRSRTSVHARRRRALFGAVLAALLACAWLTGELRPRSAADRQHRLPGNRPTLGLGLDHPSSIRWPDQGQAALAVGGGPQTESPNQQPAPIASVAKVMTALLTLERYPLSAAQDGVTITVTEDEAQFNARGQSIMAVRVGEELTERQLLEALLIPSGNNIAWTLAARVAGSGSRFVREMNAEARALGMSRTTYTDPSGFNPGTVSTAADQLRVLAAAMRFPVFRQIVSMPSVTLPVAGTLRNYNPLIADGYGGKTGSDSAAGGCLAFFTNVTVDGHAQTALGVVLGQGQGSDTSAILAAAAEAATQLVDSVAHPSGMSSVAAPPVGSQPLLPLSGQS